MSRARSLLALLLSTLLLGCVSIPVSDVLPNEYTSPVELADTPFFPQEKYQCGPAALLTLLSQSGVDTTMDEMISQVFLPGRKGSLQVELLAATRASGRIPYIVDPSLRATMEELIAGRPVLVLQNLGVSWVPRWHYAVISGIDPENGTVILRSGTDRRRITKIKTFMRTWQRSGSWGFVALRPGDLPAQPDPQRYFESVAGMESTGRTNAARKGWQAAYQRWPNEPVALFGIANANLAAKDYVAAERYYLRLLEVQPDLPIARNNFALALSALGRHDEALQQIGTVLDNVDPADPLLDEYRATLAELQSEAPPGKVGGTVEHEIGRDKK